MLILSIVLVGFGVAFDVLGEHGQFQSLPVSLYSTFMVSQGEFYLDDGGFPSSYGKFLQMLCVVIVVVVITIMVETPVLFPHDLHCRPLQQL